MKSGSYKDIALRYMYRQNCGLGVTYDVFFEYLNICDIQEETPYFWRVADIMSLISHISRSEDHSRLHQMASNGWASWPLPQEEILLKAYSRCYQANKYPRQFLSVHYNDTGEIKGGMLFWQLHTNYLEYGLTDILTVELAILLISCSLLGCCSIVLDSLSCDVVMIHLKLKYLSSFSLPPSLSPSLSL